MWIKIGLPTVCFLVNLGVSYFCFRFDGEGVKTKWNERNECRVTCRIWHLMETRLLQSPAVSPWGIMNISTSESFSTWVTVALQGESWQKDLNRTAGAQNSIDFQWVPHFLLSFECRYVVRFSLKLRYFYRPLRLLASFRDGMHSSLLPQNQPIKRTCWGPQTESERDRNGTESDFDDCRLPRPHKALLKYLVPLERFFSFFRLSERGRWGERRVGSEEARTRLRNKWSIKLLPTLLRALNNSWILSSRMLHSWQLRVCATIIAIWDVSGGETVSKKTRG